MEQMKLIQTEEILQTELATSSSISMTQSMKDRQPQSTTPEGISMISTATTTKVHKESIEIPMIKTSTQASEVSSQGSSEVYDNSTEILQRFATSTASVVSDNYHVETPEVNEEITEMNYELSPTPETNHESPEPVQESQESNQEVSEESEENSSNIERSVEITQAPQYNDSTSQLTQTSVTQVSDDPKKKDPTVDSVVSEIYGIVKTTTSFFSEESDSSESKSDIEISIEKSEKIEDEEEESR